MLYKADRLTKVFAGRKVLDIVNFVVEKHKIYALTGANGAGKSTLLTLLAFLDQPDQGELRFGGSKVYYDRDSLLQVRRQVVLLDQYPILFTGPVWKNVEFGLKVRGVKRRQPEQRVSEVLALVGMEKFCDADARKLSGGESKRVALARGLAVSPDVLLCDEPTANVDEENQEIILDILKRINAETGTSIIMATHYLSQGRQLADHSLILSHGKLSGRGHENSFRCNVMQERDGLLLCELNDSCRLHLEKQQDAELSGPCRVYIDPAKICCSQGVSPISANQWTGKVLRIEQAREHILLTVDCGLKVKVQLDPSAYQEQNPLVGEQIELSIPGDSVFLSPLYNS